MKVCFVNRFNPNPSSGGIERATFNLINYFNRNGIEAYCCVPNGGGGRLHHASDESNAKVVRDFCESKDITIIIDQLQSSFLNHRYFTDEYKIIRCIHYDPIFKYRIRALWSCVDWRDKTSYINLAFILNSYRSRYQARLEFQSALSLTGVDKLVVLSPAYQNFIKSSCILGQNKLTVIPNATEESLLNRADISFSKSKTIVWCGRILQLHKNILFLIKLWKILMSKFPDWNLQIVGDGPDRKRLELEIKKHNLERIEITGTTNPYPYYEKAAVFAFPSFTEGFPMVMLEAMAHGAVPVVFDTTKVFRDIIKDGSNGFIIKNMNTRAYADACPSLMADIELRQKMSIAARNKVKDYDIPGIAERWKGLFDELVQ